MVVTLGQQYNIGEKPTVIMHTYINRHALSSHKIKTFRSLLSTFQHPYWANGRERLPWSQANNPKKIHIMKNQREIKGPRKVYINAIVVGKKTENKAPDSQTSQATYRAKEIDRAHRSHSTREAKQNKANKNRRSPIQTIKSHDSIPVHLLGRGVF